MTDGAFFRCWISGLIFLKMDLFTIDFHLEDSPKSSEVSPFLHVTWVRGTSPYAARVRATSPETAKFIAIITAIGITPW